MATWASQKDKIAFLILGIPMVPLVFDALPLAGSCVIPAGNLRGFSHLNIHGWLKRKKQVTARAGFPLNQKIEQNVLAIQSCQQHVWAPHFHVTHVTSKEKQMLLNLKAPY